MAENPQKSRKFRWQKPRWLRWMDDHFNDVVVALIALVTVYGGLVAYLETWADNGYAAAVREGQALAMDALGNEMSSRQRENHDFYLYSTWDEWQERHTQAEGYDEPLAVRAEHVMNLIEPQTPLLDESEPYFHGETMTQTQWVDLGAYHVDTTLVETTELLERRAFAIERASIWNSKADGYVTVLTIIAVGLFLYGLSTTLKGDLRYLFVVVGSILVVLSGVGTVNLTLRPVPAVPDAAIEAYAEGVGLSWLADYEGAVASFDTAAAAYPPYANVYAERGKANLRAEDYAAAVADFELAIAHGHESASAYWELGWSHYLLGNYESSIAASRRALELDPNLLPVVLNIATAQLAAGDSEAATAQYELALTMAADPESLLPTSWSHLYLRESVNDLDRLIAALDRQAGFQAEPDLSQVADRAGLRAAAGAARQRLKEGLVALEVAGRPGMEGTGASLTPLTFGRYVGRAGQLLGQDDAFARGDTSVVAALSFENLPAEAVVSRRVRWQWSDEPGLDEPLPTMGEDLVWEGAPSGVWQHPMEPPWPGDRGLRVGRYEVEYYVNGQLLQTGGFVVPPSDESIIGSIAFGTECGSGGVPVSPAAVFAEGTVKIHGMVNYSGVPDGTVVRSDWYRDDTLYSSWGTDTVVGWGSQCFNLNDVPAGDYRLELVVESQAEPVQAAEFRVLPIDDYLQAIGLEPDDSRFHLDLGDAYAYAGDYEEAAAHYQRAIDLNLKCAQCYQRWWALLYAQGRYQEAADKLQQAIALRPEEYNYLIDLGETYYQLGAEEQATAAYRQALPDNPAAVYNEWGNTLYGLARYEEAAAKYRQSLELQPGDEVVHSNLGGAYSKMGEYEAAEAEFEKALALDPYYATPYNKWGDALYDQERYAEAAEKYRRAMELDPGEALYASNLGWATYNAGEYEQSLSAFERATGLDPNRPSDYNTWGNALYALERYAEAAEKYRQAIQLRPDIRLYHSNLGWAYVLMRDYAAAAPEFERAVELDPESASDWNMWGRSLYEQGQYQAALEKYQRAVELAPETAVYHFNLGITYYQLEQDDLALAAFEQAAELAAQAGDEGLLQDAEEMIDRLE